MKNVLLMLTLMLAGSMLEAAKPKSNLTIVDAAVFFASDFWETTEGKAFWETTEGKTDLKIMLDYQDKMESK